MGDSRGLMDSSDTEHQISDGVGVLITAAPLDRFALLGAHPDHALLAPYLPKAEGVAHVSCPQATVRIERLPGGRLNGDGAGHGSFAC